MDSTTIQTNGFDRSAHSSVGTRIEMQISTPPIVGVPAFFWCALRAFFADVLADLKLAQPLDHERPDQQADEQRRQAGKRGAKRQVAEDAKRRK